MPVSSQGPITRLIEKLKAGDRHAAEGLWKDCYPRLVALVRKKLGATPRRVADEDDVVLSAFDSFCRGALEGRFPTLTDSDDLWSLLVMIADRKAIDLWEHNNAQKRGAGRVRGDSFFEAGADGAGLDGVAGEGIEPDVAVQLAEELESLLQRLDDPDDLHLRTVAVWKMEGYTNGEIAQKLGCAVPTVGRRLALIRTVLGEGCPSPTRG